MPQVQEYTARVETDFHLSHRLFQRIHRVHPTSREREPKGYVSRDEVFIIWCVTNYDISHHPRAPEKSPSRVFSSSRRDDELAMVAFGTFCFLVF